jgi:hypothetical protein
MEKTRKDSSRIAGICAERAFRDGARVLANPVTFHHRWLCAERIVEYPGNNRCRAVIGRQITGLWRHLVGRAGEAEPRNVCQAQDFADLFWLLSLPGSRMEWAAAAASGFGASCN